MTEIKLEVGKYYKTRDGRKVHIWAKNPYNDPEHYLKLPFIGHLFGSCDPYHTWLENGCHDMTEKKSSHDLVSEWVEQERLRVHEGWLNIKISPAFEDIKESTEVWLYDSREEAKEGASWDRGCGNKIIGIRKIRYTEGGKIEDITDETEGK